MFQRSSLSTLAVLAVGGALIAGCSSSSSAATGVSAADCKIISPIGAGVVTVLTPLQTESRSKAEAGIKAYIAKLAADEAKLTSAAGKAALGSFITSLEKSLTESTSAATGTLTTAIGGISTACPS